MNFSDFADTLLIGTYYCMALTPKSKKDFNLKIKDSREHGENIVFIKGGSVILDDQWVFFPDLRIDLAQTITSYVNSTSRRIFNNLNDTLYVLIVFNKIAQIEVIPSVSYNKKSFGEVKVFPDLSGKLPLILVRLIQDGSSNLKAYKTIQKEDIEVYKGYGNYTTRGAQGDPGEKGITGLQSFTGLQGLDGHIGLTGIQGDTGVSGNVLQGVTGIPGLLGAFSYAYIVDSR
jgi:hypothetical protein